MYYVYTFHVMPFHTQDTIHTCIVVSSASRYVSVLQQINNKPSSNTESKSLWYHTIKLYVFSRIENLNNDNSSGCGETVCLVYVQSALIPIQQRSKVKATRLEDTPTAKASS